MSVFQFLKSKSFFIQVAIAIVGLLVFIFALKYWLGFSTNHDQKIQVPNLHKMSLEDVDRKLKELNLDFIVIDSASYNPNYPKKSVIEQTPESGDFVKEKRKIYLTLNPSKYRDVTIPDLKGRTKRQAISQLRSKGLNVGTNYTFVRDIGKDVVRGLRYKGKILNSGDKLPLNSIVDLVLGDGKGN
ncbi:PASTA domain-containing protein [Polaribacter sp. Hel1_85]|uniref:PASTA domain-containing protein n=1 Tax=Polaribacter sp. Hel1_85 TaxID=1250005 RepID=UPI00052D017D|nr:PASTA domain-containing protein [Polaribacter sp. Hel1_85]KGL64188.1 serine/threonine protein kinase [Polaribacter sp. Hel1_85]